MPINPHGDVVMSVAVTRLRVVPRLGHFINVASLKFHIHDDDPILDNATDHDDRLFRRHFPRWVLAVWPRSKRLTTTCRNHPSGPRARRAKCYLPWVVPSEESGGAWDSRKATMESYDGTISNQMLDPMVNQTVPCPVVLSYGPYEAIRMALHRGDSRPPIQRIVMHGLCRLWKATFVTCRYFSLPISLEPIRANMHGP